MRYPGNQPRNTAFGRAPRKTNDEQQLKQIYAQYIRIRFDPREARFKTLTHHTSKI